MICQDSWSLELRISGVLVTVSTLHFGIFYHCVVIDIFKLAAFRRPTFRTIKLSAWTTQPASLPYTTWSNTSDLAGIQQGGHIGPDSGKTTQGKPVIIDRHPLETSASLIMGVAVTYSSNSDSSVHDADADEIRTHCHHILSVLTSPY
jgi:hypothetical protein